MYREMWSSTIVITWPRGALANLSHEDVKCAMAINSLSAEGPCDNWLVGV